MTTASVVTLRCESCDAALRATRATLALLAALVFGALCMIAWVFVAQGSKAMMIASVASFTVVSFVLFRYASFDVDEEGQRREALASLCRTTCATLFALMAFVGAGLMIVSAVTTRDGSDAFTALAPGFIYGGLALGLRTRDPVTWRVSAALTGVVVCLSLVALPTLIEHRAVLTDNSWAAELAKIEVSRWEVASLSATCVLSFLAFALLLLWHSSWKRPTP